jgi:2-haloacid dehalogenase
MAIGLSGRGGAGGRDPVRGAGVRSASGTRPVWGSGRFGAVRPRTLVADGPAGPDGAGAGSDEGRARRPRAVLVDVYGTLLRVEALRRRFRDVGRPDHEHEVVLARAARDGAALAMTGTRSAFADVLRDALHAVAGPALSDDAAAHVLDGLRALPRHPDAEPALAALARSRVPAWAVAQGAGGSVAGALDATGLRSFLRGTIATDDLAAVPPHRDGYHLACAAARIDPATTAFVSTQPFLVHGAMRAGLVGALVLREGETLPSTVAAPHITAATLADATDRLLTLPA